MKIGTFNVNGITSRPDSVLEWPDRESPDNEGRQEIENADFAFPAVDYYLAPAISFMIRRVVGSSGLSSGDSWSS